MSKSREIKKKSGQRGREIDGVNPRASFTRMDPGKAAVCASAIPKHDTARRKALIFPSISPSIFSWLRGRDRQMERRTAEDVICYSGAPERELPGSWRKAKWLQTSLVFFQALRLTVEHLMIEFRLNGQSRPVCCCNRGPHRRGPTDATSHAAGRALIYDRHTLHSGLATLTVHIFTYKCLTWGTTQCCRCPETSAKSFAQQHICTQYFNALFDNVSV